MRNPPAIHRPAFRAAPARTAITLIAWPAHSDAPLGEIEQLVIALRGYDVERKPQALKHARATHAHVRIRRQADALTVEILDDGNPISGGTGTGHGLAGMRERVEHFGGELNTGPRPEGGFAVRATLPVP